MPSATANGFPYPIGSDQLADTDTHIKALADFLQANQYLAAVAPTFATGWSNQGGTDQTAEYYKDGRVVALGGAIKNATAGASTIFTLPAGYRPPADLRFVVLMGSTTVRVDVAAATGVVSVAAGYLSNNVLSLNNIRFRVA